MTFIRPVGNSMYGIYEPFGVRLINRFRLGFSYLKNISLDIILPILWTHYAHTEHSFLHYQNNVSARPTLMNELNNTSNAINSLNSTDFIRVFLYGDRNAEHQL